MTRGGPALVLVVGALLVAGGSGCRGGGGTSDAAAPDDAGGFERGVLEGPAGPGAPFTDVTASAGLAYRQAESTFVACPASPATCEEASHYTGGAAAADFDGDGDVDLLVTRLGASALLFRNRGDGTFEDATAAAGLGAALDANGAGWADLDGDGALDLYLTTFGGPRHLLYRNDGAGHFVEEGVARGAALAGSSNLLGTGLAFGDYDRDGFLDLYVGEWRRANSGAASGARLLRNRGTSAPGFFEDRTGPAGLTIDPSGADGVFVFAPAFADLDGDGWPDLALAADYKQSRLFWNAGDGTFVDGTRAAGVGTEEDGMGSAIGDVDGDGRLDWFVTSIYASKAGCAPMCPAGGTGNRLFHNEGGRRFADHTAVRGVADGGWGWGAAFFDFDGDADLDLVMTNGIDFVGSDYAPYRADAMRLWRNDDAGTMHEIGAAAGAGDTRQGRGLLVFDYDGDGDLDVFVANHGGGPLLLRNDAAAAGAWLRVRLEGAGGNRAGLGALVTVRSAAGGPAQVRELGTGSHYLGQGEAIATFGLGPGILPVAEVTVRWPRTGAVSTVYDVPRGITLTVREEIPDAGAD